MTYEEEQREREFCDILDEVYPEYTLGELTFTASDILKSCDPIAFRVYLSDWESEQNEDDMSSDDRAY